MLRPALALTAVLVVAAGGLVAAPPAVAAPVRDTSSVCPSDRLPPLPFVDVRGGAQATEVACALGLGVVLGATSTVFSPSTVITRGHVAVLVVRAARRAEVELPRGSTRYSDTAGTTAEVEDAIARIAEAGITRGFPDGTFRPAAPLPRDQAASMVVRLQQRLGGPVPAPEDCFDDDAGTHQHAIGRTCALGVVQGSADRRYSPRTPLARAQLAAMLVRLLDVDADAGLVRPLPPVPAYTGTASPIDDATAGRMSSSHRAGCPVALADLRLLQLRHWGFDGRTHVGDMVVHADAAQAVLDAFGRLYAARTVVERVRLVDEYGGDDDRSMAANNTSAYNCRTVAGSTAWSQHAYGRALDLNPVQNPYVTSRSVEPAAGRAYLDRSDVRPGMAVAGGPVVEAFRASGWGWGGDFTASKDYQHFSANGR
jgi:poly-gamma-glutamate synthesis protein (capsule biosynthesis protein)